MEPGTEQILLDMVAFQLLLGLPLQDDILRRASPAKIRVSGRHVAEQRHKVDTAADKQIKTDVWTGN